MIDAKEKAILEDRSTSYWLKDAIVALNQRDVVDATRDAEVLCELMQDKESAALGRPKPPQRVQPKKWPVVFIEGGLVNAVLVFTDGVEVTKTTGYSIPSFEVVDYDCLKDDLPQENAERWEGFSEELKRYFQLCLPDEYAQFMDQVAEAKATQAEATLATLETPAQELLRVAKDTLKTLKEAQTSQEGPCQMPWPEADKLEQAIKRIEDEEGERTFQLP